MPEIELPEGPLTPEFFEQLLQGHEITLYYWSTNRGTMRWKHDRVGHKPGQLNSIRVFGQTWDARSDDWSEVSDYLYEFGGYVCRGSGAEPVHAIPPQQPDTTI